MRTWWRWVGVLAVSIPALVGAQSDAEADILLNGMYSANLPCGDHAHFVHAEATCTLGNVVGFTSAQIGGGSFVPATFMASLTPTDGESIGTVTTAGFVHWTDYIMFTGPVTPTQIVFHFAYTVDGGELNGLGVDQIGSMPGTLYVTTVEPYITAGYNPFGYGNGAYWLSIVAGYTFSGTGTGSASLLLADIDALDANGNSVLPMDELHSYYNSKYRLGDPNEDGAVVPEPSSFALLGIGLVGFLPVVRRRRG